MSHRVSHQSVTSMARALYVEPVKRGEWTDRRLDCFPVCTLVQVSSLSGIEGAVSDIARSEEIWKLWEAIFNHCVSNLAAAPEARGVVYTFQYS